MHRKNLIQKIQSIRDSKHAQACTEKYLNGEKKKIGVFFVKVHGDITKVYSLHNVHTLPDIGFKFELSFDYQLHVLFLQLRIQLATDLTF
jgi:hypothetical protein